MAGYKFRGTKTIDSWVERPDPDDNSQGAKWDRNFLALRDYIEEHGHSKIPRPYVTEDGLALGSWVRSLRRNLNAEAGAHSKNSQIKIKLLDSIGFAWRTHEIPFIINWDKAIAHLKEFVRENGHGVVPLTSPRSLTEFDLGKWTYRVRMRYKSGDLTDDQIKILNELGFAWDARASTWENSIRELSSFIDEHGTGWVPGRWVQPNGFRLGLWAETVRRRVGQGNLSAERIKELNDLNFVWSQRKNRTGANN